ncbi:gamma-aminobutyric acid receptor alpha-like isoform X2 [Dendronephthya gigantea]|uniref:gamma-aminobutyric acid receptor alpha-like isoform X2 n=1 Tax=Dendronephthya gigantea TaxID=151771 RepID=UPI001069007B|nr:gamma-aminobutyric acid receptor alpha-like isoform X2 [Dendronephthya gigantea]
MKWFQGTVLFVLANAALISSKPTAAGASPGADEKRQSMETDFGGNRTSRKKKYCSSSSDAAVVMQKIMNDSKYNVHTIPSFGDGGPLEVKLALTVLVFRDMSEVDMTYTVDFFLRTNWQDKRLANSLNCTLTMTLGMKHPAEIIWVPDTMIENAVTSYLHEVLTNNHKIDISPNGDVFWSTRVTVKAMCPMNLVKYPRDKQTCFVDLLSYAYTTDLIKYVWNEKNPVSVMDKTLSQFDVTSYNKKNYTLSYAAGEYSILKAIFVFERRLGYYLIQVYIPCIFLVVLAGLSFWVDARATPARVALSLTTLLTIATIWSATNSNMPPVSYVKAVDIYFLTSFGFVLLTLLEYIVVLNYNILKNALQKKLNMCDTKKNIKEKESFCLKHGSLLNRRTTSRGSVDNAESPMEQYSNGKYEMAKTELNRNIEYEEEDSEKKENDIKLVTKIDKITKFVYPAAYVVFNVVYWYQLSD